MRSDCRLNSVSACVRVAITGEHYERTFKQPSGFYLHDLPHVGLRGHNQLVVQHGLRRRLMVEQ